MSTRIELDELCHTMKAIWGSYLVYEVLTSHGVVYSKRHLPRYIATIQVGAVRGELHVVEEGFSFNTFEIQTPRDPTPQDMSDRARDLRIFSERYATQARALTGRSLHANPPVYRRHRTYSTPGIQVNIRFSNYCPHVIHMNDLVFFLAQHKPAHLPALQTSVVHTPGLQTHAMKALTAIQTCYEQAKHDFEKETSYAGSYEDVMFVYYYHNKSYRGQFYTYAEVLDFLKV